LKLDVTDHCEICVSMTFALSSKQNVPLTEIIYVDENTQADISLRKTHTVLTAIMGLC